MARATVLVTGGSRGIGRAVVEALVQDGGFAVAFTYREGESAARVVEAASGGAARAYRLDLRDRERPETLVGEIEATLGPLDGLVNNAGVRQEGLLAMISDAAWDEVLDANLGGAFRMLRAVLPGMLRRRRGSIVNVASLSALHGVAGQAAYAASKAGVLGMTRAAAREVGRRGVRVNAVVPGFVPTDLTRDVPPERVAALRAGESLPVGAAAGDVAAAVLFLLSDGAAAITGQTLIVDAGASA